MRRRSLTPSPSKRNGRSRELAAAPRRTAVRWVLVGLAIVVAVATVWSLVLPPSPGQLKAKAETAARASDWPRALKAWRALNQTGHASATSLLGEARACLALDLAAQAETALARACELEPAAVEPWLLRLGILHVENRTLEAQRVGWAAYAAVAPSDQREVLRALTLALLTETPEDLARQRLGRWVAADPEDLDALAALYRRIAAMPRAGDPDRPSRIAVLSSLLAAHPKHLGVREALIIDLADAGSPDRARTLLDTWPEDARDARYFRLKGRWALDYERHPDRAVTAFEQAKTELPDDWNTHYGLAKALKAQGQTAEAQHEAEAVARLRELLSPDSLGRRLTAAFEHLDRPASCLDLASLCDSVGLDRLATAWRQAANQPPSAQHSPLLGPGLAPMPAAH